MTTLTKRLYTDGMVKEGYSGEPCPQHNRADTSETGAGRTSVHRAPTNCPSNLFPCSCCFDHSFPSSNSSPVRVSRYGMEERDLIYPRSVRPAALCLSRPERVRRACGSPLDGASKSSCLNIVAHVQVRRDLGAPYRRSAASTFLC